MKVHFWFFKKSFELMLETRDKLGKVFFMYKILIEIFVKIYKNATALKKFGSLASQ